jgi:serine phosphatase RsbU (regulator of sigma subunit)
MEAGLYPRLPLRIPGVSVEVRFRAREQLLTMGGDFFGLIARSDGALEFVMGDVSGHGPDSAALGATLRASWRALAMSGADLVTMIEILDRLVIGERRSEQQFVTLLVAHIDPSMDSLALINAGHPPPIIAGTRAQFVDCPPAAPLGFRSAAPPVPMQVSLPDNWNLLLYTDGLFEGRVAPGSSRRFGLEWLLRRVDEATDLNGVFLDNLIAEIQRAQAGPLMDDVVAMLLSEGTPAGAPLSDSALAEGVSN